MDADEARELFSDAFDGELDEAQQAAFDARLQKDPELRAEYDDFVETMDMVGHLGDDAAGPSEPNLLPGIQDRLRKRSRGRYYRDRFSRDAGRFSWMVMLLAVVTVVLVAGAVVYAVSGGVHEIEVEGEGAAEPEGMAEPEALPPAG